MDEPRIRIGELSHRTGVSTVLLRAWETRYRLLSPERSPGGTRLYSATDVARVEEMLSQIGQGISPAEAALRIRRGETGGSDLASHDALEAGRRRLRESFIALDGGAADQALGTLLDTFSFENVAAQVLLPYLQDVGWRWERGKASIAEEHLATNVIRGRLLGLARASARPRPGAVVLACPPGELHDLPLAFLSVGLAQRGWEFTLLGADTPIDTMAEAAAGAPADAVVVSAMFPERLADTESDLAALAAEHRVFLAGPGASPLKARAVGARYLDGGPVTAVLGIEDALSEPD